MQPERWERLQQLYLDALELPRDEQEGFIERACGQDEDLRAEVAELLAADTNPDPLLERSHEELMLLAVEDEEQGPTLENVGPYRIVEEIGRGGMGRVYRAERSDNLFDRTVALKILSIMSRDDVAVARFGLEQRILARLEHRNIARLYDAGFTDDGIPYLGMELVEGDPIHRFCDRKCLPVADRLALFEQVCQAVEYAHRSLVIHRDLKPNNIFVTEGGEVKLLDFGIAKLVEAPDGGSDGEPLTRPEQRILTPEYASPEQLLGEGLTTASDVYSLGVVLHRLVTGRLPERGDGDETIITPSHAVRVSRFPEADQAADARGTTADGLHKAIRGEIDAILTRALHFEPGERYPSAAALGEDLRNWREGRPLNARPPTVSYRLRKFVRRNRTAVAGVAAFTIALAVGGVGLVREQARTARERDRAELEAARAERVTEFMQSIFTANRPGVARGDSITVRQVLDAASQRVSTELEDQPDVQLVLFHTMGEVYRSIGEYDEARRLLEQGLSTADAMANPDSLRVAELHNELGNVLEGLGAYAEAERNYVQALGIRRQVLGPDHTLLSQSALNLGLFYTYEGRLDEAEPLLKEAVRIDSLTMVADTSTPLGYSLNNFALLRYHQGRFEDAAALWEDAHALRQRTHGRLHPRTVTTLSNLGTLLGVMGAYERSLPFLREAVDVQRALHGDAHPDLANTLGNLASTLQITGELDEAESMIREALQMNRDLLGADHHEVAANLNVLGMIEDDRGDHDAALGHKLEALDMVRAFFDPTHQRIALQAQSTATTYTALGRCDLAEPLFRQTLEILPLSQPEDGPRMAHARVAYSVCLTRDGRFDEAERLLLPSHDILLAEYGERDRRTVLTREALVDLYTAWSRPDEAERWAGTG